MFSLKMSPQLNITDTYHISVKNYLYNAQNLNPVY